MSKLLDLNQTLTWIESKAYPKEMFYGIDSNGICAFELSKQKGTSYFVNGKNMFNGPDYYYIGATTDYYKKLVEDCYPIQVSFMGLEEAKSYCLKILTHKA